MNIGKYIYFIIIIFLPLIFTVLHLVISNTKRNKKIFKIEDKEIFEIAKNKTKKAYKAITNITILILILFLVVQTMYVIICSINYNKEYEDYQAKMETTEEYSLGKTLTTPEDYILDEVLKAMIRIDFYFVLIIVSKDFIFKIYLKKNKKLTKEEKNVICGVYKGGTAIGIVLVIFALMYTCGLNNSFFYYNSGGMYGLDDV